MGRHREFDVEMALDAALAVFWRNGFEGTSYSDLTEATGVARPGLYTVFGNKEELFLKALDRYEATHMRFMQAALDEPSALEVARQILMGSADLQTGAGTPKGCLGINGALASSSAAEPIRKELVTRRRRNQAILLARFKRAKAEGDLPRDSDPKALARYVMAIAQGMAVQAKAGATRKDLRQLAETALASWPLSTKRTR